MSRFLPASTDTGSLHRPSPRAVDVLGTQFISSFFLLVGLAAIGMLVAAVLADADIQASIGWTAGEPDDTRPSLILAFLDNFGLVITLLTLGFGTLFFGLGIALRSRSLTAAKHARVALIWLAVGLILVIVLGIFNEVQQTSGSTAGERLPALALAAAAVVLTLFAYRWLGRHFHLYSGAQKLGDDATRLAWSLLVPALTVVILVAARPLEQTFIRSLTDKRFASQDVPSFVGLQNYQRLFGLRFDTVECRREQPGDPCSVRDNGSIRWESIDRELLREGYRTVWNLQVPLITGDDRSLAVSGMDADFIKSIATTLVFTAASVSLELIIALFMALTVNSDFVGRGLMRAVMLIPWAIPTVISARLWELMLKDTSAGIINRILLDLSLIGQPQAWLSDPALQLPAAVMVDVWKTSPFMALLLLAGLQLIPSDLYEAADVDGASKLRQLFAITLPLLRPTIMVALIFRTLDALRVFDLFNVLFGRQQLTMATYNYETLVNNQQDGYASAVSVVIFFLIFTFAVIYVRILKVETN